MTPSPDPHNVEQSRFAQDWLAAWTREYLEQGDRDWDAFQSVIEAIQEVTQLHTDPDRHWESGGPAVVPPGFPEDFEPFGTPRASEPPMEATDDSVMGYTPGEDARPRPRRSWGGR